MLYQPEALAKEKVKYLVQGVTSSVREHRGQISPERQYLFGMLFTYICLMILTQPQNLPNQEMTELAELATKEGRGKFSLSIYALIGFFTSLDGATRIALERLPLYKAYVKVFLLNK